MPFDIFKNKICYASFEPKVDSASKLLRCSRCQCAYYKSKEDQIANWKFHKAVCKKPQFDVVAKLSASQCLNILYKSRQFDHNTAAIFERLFDWMRKAHKEGMRELDGIDLLNYGEKLHAISRKQIPFAVDDALESDYRQAWACPGIPQLMFFTDLKSIKLKKLMKDYPDGYPRFTDEDEACDFSMKYEFIEDDCAEEIAWFIIGFLVRSRVWGNLAAASNHDGRGNLRDSPYGLAATKRVGDIFASKMLRGSIRKAAYPIPGFLLNIAENKPREFEMLLEMGVAPGIIEWADISYAQDAMRIISKMRLEKLSENRRLDLLELCCSIFNKYGSKPWYDSNDRNSKDISKVCVDIVCVILNDQNNAKQLLEKGMCRRQEKETAHKYVDTDFDRLRLPLAYLHAQFSSLQSHPTSDVIEDWLKDHEKLEDWEKIDFAEQVMDSDKLLYFTKQAEESKERREKWRKEK